MILEVNCKIRTVLEHKIAEWNNKPIVAFCNIEKESLVIDRVIEVPEYWSNYKEKMFYSKYFRYILERAEVLQYDIVYLVIGCDKEINENNQEEIISTIIKQVKYYNNSKWSIAIYQRGRIYIMPLKKSGKC